ncbi:MAG: oligosaccharide flippase family protein [Vicinamibacterales bacterium]
MTAPAAGIPTPESDPAATPAGHIVGRGMLALVFSQLITTPVSMLVQALIARRLGAGPFGAIYFATAALGVWYLFVEWGGHAQVAAEVARDRRAGGRLFASGMLLRLLFAVAVLTVIPWFGRWMNYDEAVRLALSMVSMKLALQGLGALCLAVVRGFEKVHWQAGSTVFGNLTEAVLVVLALIGGGGLREVLLAQVVAAALTLAVQIGMVVRLRLGPWKPEMSTAWTILRGGFSFLVLDMVLRLQPYVDATFLEQLAPPETLGWHSAASRISGVLVFPALTLNFALYPTLVRLWNTDRPTYDSLVRLGLRTVTILGLLAGTGTALFAPWAVGWIYGNAEYAPAGASLSIMSVFILLVYGSIILGPSIAAARRQWLWCGAQSLCLLVSVALDPILIPWTQRAYGNGSLGVSIAVGVAEVAMVSLGLYILPAGVLNRALGRTLLRSMTAAGLAAMVGVLLLATPIVAIPATALTYFVTLRLFGELDPELLTLAPPWLAKVLRPWLTTTS